MRLWPRSSGAPRRRSTKGQDSQIVMLMTEAGQGHARLHEFPARHRAKLRCTNPLERLKSEIKRRTEVVGIFPTEGAITRRVGEPILGRNDGWAMDRAQ